MVVASESCLVTNIAANWYAGVGIHDSDGKDNHIDFRQVWNTSELFTWAEIGYKRPDGRFGETTHLHYWHQDERVEAGVEQSWGWRFPALKYCYTEASLG